MIKVLIISKDFTYCKNIINTILCRFNNIQIKYILENINEAIYIVYKKQIDLLLIDLSITEQYYLKTFIKLENLCRDRKIILIPIINKSDIELENLYKNIQLIIKKSNENIRNKDISSVFRNELTKLGFNFKYKGTIYMLEALMYIYRNNIDLLDNLEKFVYKSIAFNKHKTEQNIKTNIVKATNLAYLYQDKQVFIDYFSSDLKPTPKVILSTILMKYYDS